MEENEMIKLEEYTEEELEELKRAMYECLRENGFTEDNVVAFRIMKRVRMKRKNTTHQAFRDEVARRIENGQTRFETSDVRTWPSAPHRIEGHSNPSQIVRDVLWKEYGLVNTERGVYEVVD